MERRTAAALAGGGLAAVALVALVDPHGPSPYPRCPTRLLAAIDCPACGGLRGVHDLLHGDLAGALDHNLLLLVVVPLLAGLWLWWTAVALGRRRPGPPPVPARALVAGIAVAAAFTVVRNVGPAGLGWLDSA